MISLSTRESKTCPRKQPHPQRFRLPAGLSAEEYYAKLLLLPELGSLQSPGVGEQRSAEQGETDSLDSASESGTDQQDTVDDHCYWNEADRTPKALSEQVVRQMVQTAWKRSQGEVSGELQQLLQHYLNLRLFPGSRFYASLSGRLEGLEEREHGNVHTDALAMRHQGFANNSC